MSILNKKLEVSILEPYRALRSNLEYALKKENAKSVLITSSEKNDGKTTVVRNLALSFANIKKSVIIIDCDFRTCGLSELYGLKGNCGVSDVVLEKEKLKFAICEKQEYISILPAGKFLNNCDDILYNNNLLEIIKVLKESYDLIIIDSPAVNKFADAQILSQIADATAIVVKSGVNKPEDILAGKQLLDNVGAKICGTILVNANTTNKLSLF